MLIVGAGVIGLEMGSVYARLGTKVTVLEYMDRLLPGMDFDCAKELQKTLKAIGIEFLLGKSVQSVEQIKQKVKLIYKSKDAEAMTNIEADYCLIAIGRRAFTDSLNIEATSITKD